MELPLTLCTYVDSSYGDLDPALGCYVTSYSHNHTLRPNQIDCSLKDPALTNPSVFLAQTSSANIPCKPIGAFPNLQVHDLSGTNHVRLLVSKTCDPLLFYIDSGAGQCLCSNDSSFVDMTPCMVEITGIAGALQIYGWGTALFSAHDISDRPLFRSPRA